MIDRNLVSFIKESLKQGSTKSNIENTLLEKGWKNEMISEGFKDSELSNNIINRDSSTLPHNRKEIFKTFVCGFLLCSSLLFLRIFLLTPPFDLFSRLNLLATILILCASLGGLIVIYLYKTNRIIDNKSYGLIFKLLFFEICLLLLSFFIFFLLGVSCFASFATDCADESIFPFFSVINLFLPVLSIVFIINSIKNKKTFFISYILVIIVLISLTIYFITIGIKSNIYLNSIKPSEKRSFLWEDIRKENNPNRCQELEDGEAIGQCLEDIGRKNNLFNDEYCAKISKNSPNSGVSCYNNIGNCAEAMKIRNGGGAYCYKALAEKNKDPQYCELILNSPSGENSISLAPSCYAKLAEITNNPIYCSKVLEIINGQETSQADIAIDCYKTLAEKNKDPQYCEILLNLPTGKNVSLAPSCYAKLAEITNNPIYCSKVLEIINGQEALKVFSQVGVCVSSFLKASQSTSISTSSKINCGNLIDSDGNKYETIKIGEQCWMAENLRTHANKNPYDRDCISYDNKQGTEDDCNLGYTLYTWAGAMDYNFNTEGAQGICPNGWHLPTDKEWHILESNLGDKLATCDGSRSFEDDCKGAAEKLKIGGSSGFNALFSGGRAPDNSQPTFSYSGRSLYGWFWTSSAGPTTGSDFTAWSYLIRDGDIMRRTAKKLYSLSVRCVKNEQ